MSREDIEKLIDDFLARQKRSFSDNWRNDLVDCASELEGEISEQTIKELQQNKLKRMLESAVDFFLAGQRDKPFSITWRNDLVKQVLELDSEMPGQYIQNVYDEKIKELRRYAMRALLRKFSIYRNSQDKAEDIVNTAFAKWWIHFDGDEENTGKLPEFNYLLDCLWSAQSDAHKDENPEVVIGIRDANRKPLKDETGKQIKLRIPSTYKIYTEHAYDVQDESDEEGTYSDGFLPESDDSYSIESVSESEERVDGEIDSPSPSADDSYVQVSDQSQDKVFNKNSKKGLTKFGDKYLATIAARGISKFYLLSGKADPARGRRTFTDMEPSYKPVRKFVTDAIKPELKNITAPTIYHKNRLRYLKFADTRQWMELAISELRKSKEKMISDAEKRLREYSNFDDIKFKRETPILSAVAVDKNGNLIDTCFKGQLDQNLKNRRDITWDKHCEYSLFVEVIQERNLHLLKGGSLYVTLEPCNKRGFYFDGELKANKPKIPCAVRCLETGIKTIYIGTLDLNPSVYEKGKEILETGNYVFEKSELDPNNKRRETEAPKLLEEYFRSKGYDFTDSGNKRTYKVGEPVTVSLFDDDLREEVLELNAWFLHCHEKDIYRKYE